MSENTNETGDGWISMIAIQGPDQSTRPLMLLSQGDEYILTYGHTDKSTRSLRPQESIAILKQAITILGQTIDGFPEEREAS